MINVELTNGEAIALDRTLGFLLEGFPQEPEKRQKLLDEFQNNTDLRDVWEQIKDELIKNRVLPRTDRTP